jgi:phospho-N-acetylmuramoyl-pentapeptide-transferase
MLYELARLLHGLPGASLLQYISFRAVAATLFSFVLAFWLAPRAIAMLRKAGIGENTDKTDSAQLAELHRKKNRTPTMGGVFIVGAMLISGLLWMRFDGQNKYSALGLLCVLWFAVVGFVDDWIKLMVPGKNGLTKRQKQGALTIGALLIGVALLWLAGLEKEVGGPRLYFPILKDASLPLGVWLGLPFLLVTILVLTGSANAVNLTDGLDGLAIGCVAFAGLAFAGITYFVGHERFAEYLLVKHVAGAGEMTVMLGSMLGASLAFLWFNAPPAQIFMGDVGSLALGGALGYAAIVSRTELVLFVVGGVFVVEALSVVLQVASFKLRGKRIFRCAPLHHHYQFAGVPETRIVARIWVVSALLSLSSLALFKVR